MPMLSPHRIDVLRLHVDPGGCVCLGDDDALAIETYCEPTAFADQFTATLARASVVRILGTIGNARLITELHNWRLANPTLKQKLIVGSPMLLPTRALRCETAAVMQALWQPPLGGTIHWHELTSFDYAAYALAAEPISHKLTQIAMRTARYHPAWRALTFVETADALNVCNLLVEILDPRWYTHPGRPTRPSRLYAHLGLTPENVLAFTDDRVEGHNAGRCRSAILSWFGRKPKRRHPGDFAWRTYLMAEDRHAGLLKATRKFVDYVRLNWLAAIAPPHREVGFDAKAFFGRDEDARAYERHWGSWSPV